MLNMQIDFVYNGSQYVAFDRAAALQAGVPADVFDAALREALLVTLRTRRDALLRQSDWTQVPDVPLTAEQRDAWAAYRQSLRAFPAVAAELLTQALAASPEVPDLDTLPWPVQP